jgi:hypothetical protein
MKTIAVYTLSLMFLISCENKDTGRIYENIEGTFTCQENHPAYGIRRYLVEIDRVKNEADLYLISNFYDAGYNEFLFARLNDSDLTISDQVVTGLLVNGHGHVSADLKRIDWEYEVVDGIATQDILALYTRN